MEPSERAELESYREQAQTATVTAAIATGLAGRVHNPAAAAQLTELLQKDVRLVELDGKKVAVGPAGQSVQDYVSTKLGDPAYAHFLGGANRGGSTSAAPAASAGVLQPGQAKELYDQGKLSLGNAVIAEHVARTAVMQASNSPELDPRTNPRLPMGVRPLKQG